MKDLRAPRGWLGAWLLLVAVVVWLSLAAPPPPPTDVPQSDKWAHLAAYAVLAAGAVQLFRPTRTLLGVLLGLVALGVVLEVAQGTLTADRVMDVRDALANTAGVVLGGLTACTPLGDLLARRSGTPVPVD